MSIESKVFKLACSGKPIPQIAERLDTKIKKVRNIIDTYRDAGKLIASRNRPIICHYKKYTRGKT